MTIEELFEHAFRAAGLPSPNEVLGARNTIKQLFSDPRQRIAFLLSMMDECADEMKTTPETILMAWAEGRLTML